MIELGRLLLAAVFAIAAMAKLADRDGTKKATQGFGAPSWLASPAAILLPVAELGIAVTLVPGATGRFGAAGAALLLAIFVLAIANAVAHGRSPDCHCFGRLHSAPAGPATLARNASLCALAVFLASRPATDPSRLELAAAGVAVLVVAQAIASYTLLRRYGLALRRIEELETGSATGTALAIGAEAPPFALQTVGGGEVRLEGLLARARPVLLVFGDPGCGPCRALMPELAAWQRALADRLTLAVVSRGDLDENSTLATEHGLHDVLVQRDREVAAAYAVEATPSALLIGSDGRIEQRVVAGESAIRELVDSHAADSKPAANGHARIAAAVAVAGGLAATAAAAHASPRGLVEQPTDPELQAIDAALKAASPRLVATSKRSLKAVRAQATFLGRAKKIRAKRTAARKALAAERREVLALRSAVAQIPETSVKTQYVKAIVDNSLLSLARSLEKRQQAIGARPTAALRLVKEAQTLFLQGVGAGAEAGKLLGRGE
jgi:peroxiredoxin/uncharacterized membrane protein YphA (DoxX/SURF4 family)